MGLQCRGWQDLGEKEVEIGDEREMEKNHGVSPDVGENLRITLARQKPNLYSIHASMEAKQCKENLGPGLRKKKLFFNHTKCQRPY